MSEVSRLTLHYQIFYGGEVIKLDGLGICPEKITLRPAPGGPGLRLDIIQDDGSNLAWFVLPTDELLIELS